MLLVGTAYDAWGWATITVNSLADPGKPGICTLRDAITAAVTQTETNGCTAGKGHDTIKFSVSGTITLTAELPSISNILTIDGAGQTVTVDGASSYRVMQVNGTLNLNKLTISNGFSVPQFGGGVLNFGTLKASDMLFSGNSAVEGAGIYNVHMLTVTKSTFLRNNGFAAGGGIANGGTVFVDDSTFSGNSGGGVFNNFGSTLVVTNSTFFGNSSAISHAAGGGIFDFGTMTVTNSTFSGNNGANSAPPVGNIFVSQRGEARLKGTILGGRPSAGNCKTANSGEITDLGYNISDDNSCGFTATGSLNDTDPMLDPAGLANNGGATQTIALVMGSPAIDAIPLDSCTDQDGNPLTTDQRGFPRPDASEQVCDIGAYEFQDFAGTPGTANCHGVSVSTLAHQFGNIKAAASALRFPSVKALQAAITAFCRA
jgi:hypothetical protein